MAVDTANKRSSAVNVSSPWRSRLPFPDGTIDQGDRQHAAYMYSGIEAGAATVATEGITFIPRYERPVFVLHKQEPIFVPRGS